MSDTEGQNRDAAFLGQIGTLIDSKLDSFKKELDSRADENLEEIRRLKFAEKRTFKRR